jgi:hypothetical protein
MDKVIEFLKDKMKGKKTYLLVLVYVVLQFAQEGSMDAIDTEAVQNSMGALILATMRAGIAKVSG